MNTMRMDGEQGRLIVVQAKELLDNLAADGGDVGAVAVALIVAAADRLAVLHGPAFAAQYLRGHAETLEMVFARAEGGA